MKEKILNENAVFIGLFASIRTSFIHVLTYIDLWDEWSKVIYKE